MFQVNEHIGRNIWPWHTFSVRMIEIKSSIWNENGLNQLYQLHKRSFLAVNRVVATFDWWTRDDFDFVENQKIWCRVPYRYFTIFQPSKMKKALAVNQLGRIGLPWRSFEVTDFDIK